MKIAGGLQDCAPMFRDPCGTEIKQMRSVMKIKHIIAAAALSVATTGPSFADMAEDVIGSWRLVSLQVVRPDGSRLDLFGQNPRGMQILSADGHFVNVITRESLPLYASANRMTGTDEEYRTIGQGSNGFFGTYSVDDDAGEVVFTIDTSIFPNWDGVEQRRSSVIEGNLWRYTNPMTVVGDGVVEVVWERQ
jgi:hypothetical protein